MAPRRFTEFDQDIADAICERLVEGESLRTICLSPELPSRSTVLKWLALHDHFARQYAYAREEQAEMFADEMMDIADHGEPDKEHNNRDRLRIDTRKWIAAKMKPKKYGDKLGLTDGEGGPLQVVINRFGEDNTSE